MTEKQFLDLIDEHHVHRNVQLFYDQLLTSKILKAMDEEIMNAFLYHVELCEKMSLEEFISLYKIFEVVYEDNKLPMIY